MLPETAVAPIETAGSPRQIALFAITEAEGKGFTVIVTEFDLAQPVAVTVSVTVYMVVTVGLTVGFEEVELNPDGELDQE